MNFPFYIAKRYLFSKSSTNAINIITYIATFGVFVGALALFIILSGFSGLRTFSDTLLDTSDSDLKITPTKGKSFLFTKQIQSILENEKNIADFSRTIEERAFLQYKDKQQIAVVKGVDVDYNNIIQIDSIIDVGDWLQEQYINTAVIGSGISYKLSLGIFTFDDALQIMVPKAGSGFLNPNNAFKFAKVQVVGTFGGAIDFQNKFVFVPIKLTQELLNFKTNEIGAVEIKLNKLAELENTQENLLKKLGPSFKIENRYQLNALYYKVINTENFISYLIFTLIVIIALFNVIGAVIMMIIDKKKNIKTLLNLGATLKDIKKIFVFQGFLLCLVGLFCGLILGAFLVLLQQQFGLFMITENIPYPVEFRFLNLVTVMFTIAILGFIAAKIASSRISKNFIEK